MTEPFDYIESYFTGRCTDTERQQFEDRCVHDQAFAEEVAFYIQTRATLKEELLSQKRAIWHSTHTQVTARLRTIYLTTAAAAAVLLLFSLYLIIQPKGPAKLAATYIRTHYDHLSQTLDGSRDSLARGITAYNNQSFQQAEDLFTPLAHNGNTDARLYSGLVYLRLKDYDQALRQFDTLANITSLYSNPGPFLKAITLLQRNAAGDREAARQLLQDVVDHQLDGSQEATAWLQKF
jgi:tetratricopeptide (TPR) repeat protein